MGQFLARLSDLVMGKTTSEVIEANRRARLQLSIALRDAAIDDTLDLLIEATDGNEKNTDAPCRD